MFDWIASLIGRRVVYLQDHDGTVTKRWATPTPFGLTCRRFNMLPHTVCTLSDGGELSGPCYVARWAAAGARDE